MSEGAKFEKKFAEIQKRFDTEPGLTKKFFADPVGTLGDEGVSLSPELATQLKHDVKEFSKPVTAAEGLRIHAPHIHVGIFPPSIRISGTF
jgi:hypothetical protein